MDKGEINGLNFKCNYLCLKQVAGEEAIAIGTRSVPDTSIASKENKYAKSV